MHRWVDIQFDCLPLRSIQRLDIPLDASPKYRARCERILAALEKHGAHNSYFLHNALCTFHLLNCDDRGSISFEFEGTVLTDSQDLKTHQADLTVKLVGETCDWLTEPVKCWFAETVPRAVAVEFDRYIEVGDLEKTRQRIAEINARSDEAGGYVGMYL